MLDEQLPPDRAGVVLHWFTGSKADVRRAVDRGCYFSVNEGMLASATGLRVMREIPIDRVLTETDGPFLTRGDKIGRASCRERVCQSVWLSVVAGSLKKNRDKKNKVLHEIRTI